MNKINRKAVSLILSFAMILSCFTNMPMGWTITAYADTLTTNHTLNEEEQKDSVSVTTLSAITCSTGNLSPEFSWDKTEYTLSVARGTQSVTVTPKTNDGKTTITVNGMKVKSGTASTAIVLTEGKGTVNIIITAPDTVTSKTYMITIKEEIKLLRAETSQSYDINKGNVNITKAGYYTIRGNGASTTNTISVAGNSGDVAIRLEDVNSATSSGTAFSIGRGTKVNLTLVGTNTLQSGAECAGLTVPEGATLNITPESKGSLSTTGGNYGAGIGGGFRQTCGTVNINGGTVKATGGKYGAGIGGGSQGGNGGNVSISGGIVNAFGTMDAAGIGGGKIGKGGKVIITGGIVTAKGGSERNRQGAGIGGGNGAEGGYIEISGGNITATGNGDAQDIGDGGPNKNKATILITGGLVNGTRNKIDGVKDKNGNSLYLVKATLEGLKNAKVECTIDTLDPYTVDSDGKGNIYLWMTEGVHSISVMDGTVHFTKEHNVPKGISTITISKDIEPNGPDRSVEIASVKLEESGDYIISGSTNINTIVINGTGIFNITLNNVSVDVSSISNRGAFSIRQGATVNLTLVGTNTLKSGANKPGIEVSKDATLNIKDSNAALCAMGGMDSAGIGIADKSAGCAINIQGGTVKAIGNGAAFGIGGGHNSTINISGGTVTASAGKFAAGIGGESSIIDISGGTVIATTDNEVAFGIGGGHDSTINISGGTVTASAGKSSAGIGGVNSIIDISGGIIVANGGGNSAGIGGGHTTSPKKVSIRGGVVTATGGSWGPGIGNGAFAKTTDCIINISKGTVKAIGGEGGAGIGGGWGGAGGTVIISGGNVTAKGTSLGSKKGKDIGVGASSNQSNGSITITGGSLDAKDMGVVPIDEKGNNVYLVTTRIKSLNKTAELSCNVNGKDSVVKTDDNGKLYLWLPVNRCPIEATYLSVEYKAYKRVEPNNTNTCELKLSRNLSLEPYTMLYTSNSIEYKGKVTITPQLGSGESIVYTYYEKEDDRDKGINPVMPVNAGTYYVCGILAEKEDYSETESKTTMTISKVMPVIRIPDEIKDLKKTYGNPEFILTGITNSINAPIIFTSEDTDSVEVDPTGKVSIKGTGAAQIKVNIPEGKNNETVSAILAITVAKKALESPVNKEFLVAKQFSKEYSVALADFLPTLSGYETYKDLSWEILKTNNLDNVCIGHPTVHNGILTFKVANVPQSNKTADISILIKSKYHKDFTICVRVKTIDRTPLAMTNIEMPNRVYSGNAYTYKGNPTFTNTATNQIVAEVTFETQYEGTGETVYAKSKTAPVNAGTYKLIIKVNGASAQIYDGLLELPFEIMKKEVVIFAADKIIAMGADIPSLATAQKDKDYTIEGLIGSDSLDEKISMKYTGTLDNSKVGIYPITISGMSLNANYTIHFENGELKIMAATQAIDAAIEAANVVKSTISVYDQLASSVANGTKFVTTAEMNTLNTAIASAQVAKVTSDSLDKVQGAVDALNHALTVFKSAIKIGTYIPSSGGSTGGGSTGGGSSGGSSSGSSSFGNSSSAQGSTTSNDAKQVPSIGTIGDVTTKVVDKEEKFITFSDISNHWAKKDIEFVASRNLLTGTQKDIFSPNASMTRGMFVTALGRLARADVSNYNISHFVDVSKGAYYLPYIEWANKKNIVNGIGETTFAPDKAITREEMAVIIGNYAKEMGVEMPSINTVIIFADDINISGWAKEATQKMQTAGIILGKKDNHFDPKGTATRAEVSAVLRRFIELAN